MEAPEVHERLEPATLQAQRKRSFKQLDMMSWRPLLVRGPCPALWRWQRHAFGVLLEVPCPARHFEGRPFLHAPLWLVEVLPLEVPEVLRIRRRAVEGPALPFDIGGQLPAEVLMDFAEGPIAEHKPHNMVGGGPSDDARVGEEHHVRLGLAVDVEGHEDLAPEERCRPTKAPLDDVPIVGEALLDELEVQPLEVLECWSIAMVQPPEGREVLMDGASCTPSQAEGQGFPCIQGAKDPPQ